MRVQFNKGEGPLCWRLFPTSPTKRKKKRRKEKEACFKGDWKRLGVLLETSIVSNSRNNRALLNLATR